MLKPRILCSSTLLALALVPSLAVAQIEPAPADPAAPAPMAPVATGDGETFGSLGQIFLTNEFDLNWTVTTSDTAEPGASKGNHIRFSPTLHYFLAPNLAVGGNVTLDWMKPDKGDAFTTFSIGPSVGYNIPLSGPLSIFPFARVSYETISSGPADIWRLPLLVHAPVMFHLMPHFSIGFGPFFALDLAAKDGVTKRTQFGLDLLLGGYF